jgi:broad specificity phosphatase PhoE
MQVYGVRHAQSLFNAWKWGKMYLPWRWFETDPELYDAHLNDIGIEQARSAAIEHA